MLLYYPLIADGGEGDGKCAGEGQCSCPNCGGILLWLWLHELWLWLIPIHRLQLPASTSTSFATIESCSIRMLTMGMVTAITRFCGLTCEFRIESVEDLCTLYCWRYFVSFLTDQVLVKTSCIHLNFPLFMLCEVSAQLFGSSLLVLLPHVE